MPHQTPQPPSPPPSPPGEARVQVPKKVFEELGVTMEGGRIQAPEGGGVIVGADGRVSFLDPSGTLFDVGEGGKKTKLEANVGLVSPPPKPEPGEEIEERVGGLRDETEGFLVEESGQQIQKITDKADQARDQQVSQIRQGRNQQADLMRSASNLEKQAKRLRFRARTKAGQAGRSAKIEAVRLKRQADDFDRAAAEMLNQANSISGQIREAQVSMAGIFQQRRRDTEAEVNQTSLRIRAKRAKDSEVGPTSTKAIDKQLQFTRQKLADAEKVLSTEVKRLNNRFRNQNLEARQDPSDPSLISIVDTKTGEIVLRPESTPSPEFFKGKGDIRGIERLREATQEFAKLKEQEDRFRIMSFGDPPTSVSITEWLGLVRDVRDQQGIATQEAVEILRAEAQKELAEQQALGLR